MSGTPEHDFALKEYLFDLQGYLILRQAIEPDHVDALNASLDTMQHLKPGDWSGYVHGHVFGASTQGLNLQQIYEAGEPWERLIDHPSWFRLAKHFIGGEGTFDHTHGPLFIDENFASIRGPGQAIGFHSGGHEGVKRTQFRFHNGRFQCGQINILMALTDIGPGDGATMVIPGSHKANLQHPTVGMRDHVAMENASMDGIEGAVEVHLDAGDVLLFVDALSHGSAARINPGQRRIAVYRYGPSWGFFRHGYRPSPSLLQRLSPERRQVVMPHDRLEQPPMATEV